MSKKSFIDSVKVGSPCSENWNQMQGTDKIRLCSHCAKHVNNLSEMTRKQATRLVLASNGNICIRYIADPVTRRPMFAEQLLQITRRTPGIAAGVISTSIALSTAAYAQENPRSAPTPTVVVSVPQATPTPDEVIAPVTDREIVSVPQETHYAMMGMMVAVNRVEYKNPLMLAVQNQDIGEIKDLIAHGASVNGKEEDKTTPLFMAVENGNLEIVETLLNFGANVNARDKQKQTPLMRLDGDATPELVERLARYGVKVNLTDNEGNTAIIIAAGIASPEVIKALIDAGADVRLGNKKDQTALMNAASNDDLEGVRLLIMAGADVNAKNKDGESAWDQTSNDEIKTLLISFGAETPVTEDKQPGDEPQ